jgi:hypothetical protein
MTSIKARLDLVLSELIERKVDLILQFFQHLDSTDREQSGL